MKDKTTTITANGQSFEGCRGFCEANVLMMKMGNMKVPTGFLYAGIGGLLKEHGRNFNPAPLPKGVRKGKMKLCFYNAALLATRKGYTYCEGYAAGIIPVLHAWCVDMDGNVVDNTWKDGHDYFGVPIKKSYLHRMQRLTGCFGVLDCWQHDWPILRDKPELWLETT